MIYWKWKKINNMKNCFRLVILFSILMLTQDMYAQQGNLQVEEVEVVKNFDAQIVNASMLPNTAKLPPIDSTAGQKSYKYNVTSSPLKITYTPEELRPLAMPRAQVPDPYQAYIKAAYGLPNSILGQVNYAYSSKNGFELGVNALHNSANNSKKVENQRYMNNDIGLNIAQVWENGIRLGARFDYSLDQYHYYGYDRELYNFSSDETLRRYHHFTIQTNLINASPNKANINYGVRFKYSRFTNNVATRQNDYDLILSATKWFNEKHPLTVEIGTEFTTLRDTAMRTLNNFYLRPSYTLHGSKYKLKLGISVYSNSDKYYFFPDAEFDMYIIDERFVGFLGADGGLTKNTYKTLAQYNPFIEARLDTIANTVDRKYYLGLKGQIKHISYRVELAYQTLKMLALYDPYEPAPDNYGFYNVQYTDGARYLLQSTVSYAVSDNFNLLFAVSKSFYQLEVPSIYGLPEFELNTKAEYLMLKDKLRLWAEFYLQDPIKFNIAADVISPEPNFLYDVSLGGEYFFSKHFGVNLQLNNVFNNKYLRWYNSPSIGFQGMIGLAARF